MIKMPIMEKYLRQKRKRDNMSFIPVLLVSEGGHMNPGGDYSY